MDTSTALVQAGSPSAAGAINAFQSEDSFISAQRMARALAASSLVPQSYQDNVADCLIAIELANRTGASVPMVMQNLDIIHGRPSWRSTFLIATVNACGRFTPLRYRWQGEEGTDTWGCRAVAKDRQDGEECVGPLVTIAMAKAEGWYAKNGSKWKTLPELMLTYRAAAFWTRVYAPELSLGMLTSEEAEYLPPTRGSQPTAGAASLNDRLHLAGATPVEATVGAELASVVDPPSASPANEVQGTPAEGFLLEVRGTTPRGTGKLASEDSRNELTALANTILGAGTDEAIEVGRLAQDEKLTHGQAGKLIAIAQEIAETVA